MRRQLISSKNGSDLASHINLRQQTPQTRTSATDLSVSEYQYSQEMESQTQVSLKLGVVTLSATTRMNWIDPQLQAYTMRCSEAEGE
jgi:hypothetical protein